MAILITTKIEEVAKFIALGASPFKIILFMLYQVPYLVQIAVPLAAVWASYTYFSHMNSDYQITALRSLGFSLKEILYPLGICAAILSCSMFFILFDVGARSHLAAKKLEFDVRTAEPLALIHTSQHLKGSEAAFDLKGSLKRDQTAHDLFACFGKKEDGLTLILANAVNFHDEIVDATGVSVITTTPVENTFSDLVIENAKLVQTPSEYLYELTGARKWKISSDHLPLRILLGQRKALALELEQSNLEGDTSKNAEKKQSRIYSEIFRRASLSIACFTLTLLGAASAIVVGRKTHSSPALLCVLYTAIFVVFYLAATSVSEKAFLAFILFFLPQIILWKLLGLRIQSLEEGRS